METTIKVHKDNGLLVNIVDLSFDEYYAMRDAVYYKLYTTRELFDEFSKNVDANDELDNQMLSDYRKDVEMYTKLLKKISL